MGGDEGDREAVHAPGPDGAAVGGVVARRAGRCGDDEAVTAYPPDLVASDGVGQVGDALAGLAMHRHVIDREPAVTVAPDLDARKREHVELARERQPEPGIDLVGIDAGEEADLPVVDTAARHPRARVVTRARADPDV